MRNYREKWQNNVFSSRFAYRLLKYIKNDVNASFSMYFNRNGTQREKHESFMHKCNRKGDTKKLTLYIPFCIKCIKIKK